MNYLLLCQRAALESRTGSFPNTVSGLTGRSEKIANWVQQAWIDIQTSRTDWYWMEDTFSGSLISGVNSYEGSDFSLTRFEQWKAGEDPETGISNFTIQKASEARSTEGEIKHVPWGKFWRTYDRGANAERTGKPIVYSVDTQRRLRVYPEPDDTYTIRGIYRKSPQTLSAASDEPEVSAAHHMVIVWRALLSLANHDESFGQPGKWLIDYTESLSNIQTDELSAPSFGGPLA